MTDKKTMTPLREWLQKHSIEISTAVAMLGGLGYAAWLMDGAVEDRDAAVRSGMMSLEPASITVEDVIDVTSKIPEDKQAKAVILVRGPEFEHDRLWLGCAVYDAGFQAFGVLRSETDVFDWDNMRSIKIERDDEDGTAFLRQMDAACGQAGEINQA